MTIKNIFILLPLIKYNVQIAIYYILNMLTKDKIKEIKY